MTEMSGLALTLASKNQNEWARTDTCIKKPVKSILYVGMTVSNLEKQGQYIYAARYSRMVAYSVVTPYILIMGY